MAAGMSIKVPRKVNGGVEVAFLEMADRECNEVKADYIPLKNRHLASKDFAKVESVHVHYIRYFEVHPPTLEGATVH